MRSLSKLLLAVLSAALFLTLSVPAETTKGSGATVPRPQTAPVSLASGEASYEALLANFARLNANDSSAERAQLIALLEALKRAEQALRQQRRAKEAELARLRSSGGDSPSLRAEIETIRAQLEDLDAKMQLLVYRIQSAQTREGIVPEPLASPAKEAKPLPLPAPATAPKVVVKSAPVKIPPEQIHAVAVRLAHSPDLSMASARSAAASLLATSHPGASDYDIDQLAQIVLAEAGKAGLDDMQAMLEEMKQRNEAKKKLREATAALKDTPDNPDEVTPEDRRRLLELATRQTKIEQAARELLAKRASAPDKTK